MLVSTIRNDILKELEEKTFYLSMCLDIEKPMHDGITALRCFTTKDDAINYINDDGASSSDFYMPHNYSPGREDPVFHPDTDRNAWFLEPLKIEFKFDITPENELLINKKKRQYDAMVGQVNKD